MKNVTELSLRPYNGKLFVAHSVDAYERAHVQLFAETDRLNVTQEGRFAGGEGKDGMWTYLVWGKHVASLAHELAHVVLHVFERCGINPIEANGEPFCYMLSQLMMDSEGVK